MVPHLYELGFVVLGRGDGSRRGVPSGVVPLSGGLHGVELRYLLALVVDHDMLRWGSLSILYIVEVALFPLQGVFVCELSLFVVPLLGFVDVLRGVQLLSSVAVKLFIDGTLRGCIFDSVEGTGNLLTLHIHGVGIFDIS